MYLHRTVGALSLALFVFALEMLIQRNSTVGRWPCHRLRRSPDRSDSEEVAKRRKQWKVSHWPACDRVVDFRFSSSPLFLSLLRGSNTKTAFLSVGRLGLHARC